MLGRSFVNPSIALRRRRNKLIFSERKSVPWCVTLDSGRHVPHWSFTSRYSRKVRKEDKIYVSASSQVWKRAEQVALCFDLALVIVFFFNIISSGSFFQHSRINIAACCSRRINTHFLLFRLLYVDTYFSCKRRRKPFGESGCGFNFSLPTQGIDSNTTVWTFRRNFAALPQLFYLFQVMFLRA